MNGFEYCLTTVKCLPMMSCCDGIEGSEQRMLENLKIAFEIMGKGMAGIFCVVLIIMLFVMVIQHFTNMNASKKEKI